jgi:hypothetical protein
MREIWRQGVFGLTALFLVGALSSIGQAFPGRDTGDCTSCHNNDGLDYEATPNLLTIAPGGDGQIDFGILALPDEEAGALVVRGLDAPGLDLAAVSGGLWTEENPSDNQYYQGFPVVGLARIPFDFGIGLLAVAGDYPITAQFVSSGQRGVTANGGFLDLTVRVVPEPSALVLAAVGLLGLAAYGWRRKSS